MFSWNILSERKWRLNTSPYPRRVLILVFVEYPFGVTASTNLGRVRQVLILVFVEYPFGASKSNIMNHLTTKVLILVFVEYPFGAMNGTTTINYEKFES